MQGAPVAVGTCVDEGEAEGGSGFGEEKDVGFVEAREEEMAGGLQVCYEGREVGEEDVAVDIRKEDVGLRGCIEAAGIAKGNLGIETVEGVVVLGVANAPFIDVVGEDAGGTELEGRNAEDAGATAGVDDGGVAEGRKVGQQAQHQARGGMLAAAKGLTGDDVQELAVGEGDGFEVMVGLPGGVPVLIGGGGGGEGDGETRSGRFGNCGRGEGGEGVGDGGADGSFGVGILLDVGGEASVRGQEGIAAGIGQQGGQHIGCRLVVGGDLERKFQIFHSLAGSMAIGRLFLVALGCVLGLCGWLAFLIALVQTGDDFLGDVVFLVGPQEVVA